MVARRVPSGLVPRLLAQRRASGGERWRFSSQALATEHFEPCLDGSREEGFEKIAIYALGAEVRHAARQEEDGTWRSKLGEDEDIEHTLDGLAGPLYGKVVAFLRRQPVGPQSVPK